MAAIRNGATGYFPLSTKASVLKHALPLILLGEIYIPACALRLDHGHAMPRPEGLVPRTRNADGGLTPRQCETIAMLGEGKSNKEIAREMRVLEGTVKLHVRGILRKLGVRNRTEAVLAAARGGYLSNGALGATTITLSKKHPGSSLRPPRCRSEHADSVMWWQHCRVQRRLHLGGEARPRLRNGSPTLPDVLYATGRERVTRPYHRIGGTRITARHRPAGVEHLEEHAIPFDGAAGSAGQPPRRNECLGQICATMSVPDLFDGVPQHE
jgi:DNA-binding CsgD family transcriptional regulator